MSVPTPAAAMAIRDSLEEEVLIALVRAAWLAAERSNAVTAAVGLSPSQYNALRILRAAGREGLSCTEIGTRMVTRDSDLTRLMSGLERDGLVVRSTDADDRRRSVNRITAAGKALLRRLDGDVAGAAKQTLGHLGRLRLTALRDLLVAFAPLPLKTASSCPLASRPLLADRRSEARTPRCLRASVSRSTSSSTS
jgi:DNA-binding MarR family transcriptional regulator